MSLRFTHRRVALFALVGSLALARAATASADSVVADDQIVAGKQCVGVLCADGEPFSGLGLKLKSGDTPGVSLVQTADSGFSAQTWDVAGNEANFFVRDITGGSRLPFRIRPGAPTSSIDIQATGDVNTGFVQQNFSSINVTGGADGPAILAALRTLPINRYTLNVDTSGIHHLAPEPASFRSAFTLGGQDDKLGAGDVAAVALAAVKALDARVTSLDALAQGPKGDQGERGAQGEQGAAGAPGPSGPAGLSADEQRIKALEASNKSLAKDLKALRKQVRKLVAAH